MTGFAGLFRKMVNQFICLVENMNPIVMFLLSMVWLWVLNTTFDYISVTHFPFIIMAIKDSDMFIDI